MMLRDEAVKGKYLSLPMPDRRAMTLTIMKGIIRQPRPDREFFISARLSLILDATHMAR